MKAKLLGEKLRSDPRVAKSKKLLMEALTDHQKALQGPKQVSFQSSKLVLCLNRACQTEIWSVRERGRAILPLLFAENLRMLAVSIIWEGTRLIASANALRR